MSKKMQVAQMSKYMHRKDSGGWDTRKKQKSSQLPCDTHTIIPPKKMPLVKGLNKRIQLVKSGLHLRLS